MGECHLQRLPHRGRETSCSIRSRGSRAWYSPWCAGPRTALEPEAADRRLAKLELDPLQRLGPARGQLRVSAARPDDFGANEGTVGHQEAEDAPHVVARMSRGAGQSPARVQRIVGRQVPQPLAEQGKDDEPFRAALPLLGHRRQSPLRVPAEGLLKIADEPPDLVRRAPAPG